MILDLIIYNADIITMDELRPRARSIGIKSGRIVGFDGDVDNLKAREKVNLYGACIIPGIIDTHCHTAWFGRTLVEIDLSFASSITDVLSILENAIVKDAEQYADNDFILATGFEQHKFNGSYPEITELDRIARGRPLVIRHSSGHASMANTEALRRAGMLHAPDPSGGRIERDAQGWPTGLLQEAAQDPVLSFLKPYSRSALGEAIGLATSVYAREGITSFADAGVGEGWIGHSPTEFRSYQDADANGDLHAKAQLMPTIDSLRKSPAAIGEGSGIGLGLGVRTGLGSSKVMLGPTKVFIDGTLSGRTGAMSQPYCAEPTNYGFLQDEESAIRSRILAAAEAGWSVAAHAIGDYAIDIAISALTEARETYGVPPMPHRIEHASYLRDDQVPKLLAGGIAVSSQAMFVRRSGDDFLKSLGERRARNVYRVRSLLDHGVLVAGSSDRPCLQGNPFEALRALVDRKTVLGTHFSPHERISPMEALKMYTADAALVIGSRDVGQLRVGMAGDLVVLSHSPLTGDPSAISEITAQCTLVDGVPTYGSF